MPTSLPLDLLLSLRDLLAQYIADSCLPAAALRVGYISRWWVYKGFLDLLLPGPEDQSPPRIPTPGKLYPSAELEHIQVFEGARDLLEPLLESPPAQLLRPRDDVAVDPLEPLLDVSYQGAQGQLRDLQGSSSTVTPVPRGSTSCTNTRSPDLSSSNSQLEVGQRKHLCLTENPHNICPADNLYGAAQEDKLSLVMQKLVDIKQRLDSLPASSKGQRKRQVSLVCVDLSDSSTCLQARTFLVTTPFAASARDVPGPNNSLHA